MKFAIRARFKQAVEKHVRSNLKISDTIIASSLGISEQKLNDILTEKSFPPVETIAKFLMSYPEIDCEWLLMGWGEMLKTEEDSNINNYTINHNNHSNNIASTTNDEEINCLEAEKAHHANLVKSMKKTIALQDRVINHLKKENEDLKKKGDQNYPFNA